jgi:hypothetical protein
MSTKIIAIVRCPHCNEYIAIEEVNCKIFRHGVFKNSGTQIDPHSPKNLCDYYVENNLIYGCGKPFLLVINNNIYTTEICNYI